MAKIYNHKIVGNVMRDIRKKTGLSQNALGSILGYGNGQLVSNWERGDQGAPLYAIKRLCKIAKVPVGTVFEAHVKQERQFWGIRG